MSDKRRTASARAARERQRLTSIEVTGFKSHASTCRIALKGLTLLCGANSSGKSSIIQPLLLVKQTLDALPADPGALKLGGENVSYTSPSQFLSTGMKKKKAAREFTLRLGVGDRFSLAATYRADGDDIEVVRTEYVYPTGQLTLRKGAVLSADDLERAGDVAIALKTPPPHPVATRQPQEPVELRAARWGPFLLPEAMKSRLLVDPLPAVQTQLTRLIHLSGHRGNPSRQYPVVAVGGAQPGLFHHRAAALVAEWARNDPMRLAKLSEAMRKLGLTWKVVARKKDATSVEVQVGRTTVAVTGGAHDLVSIADVGFGVSQTLPVVVALVAAAPNQIVFIEQPEIHLHPRAQKAMADLIAVAVQEGVRVIVETHSEVILTRLQYLIANGDLSPGEVVAHWFQRDLKTGRSTVVHAEPGPDGSLGDWPADFADVAAEVDREYAEAAYEKLQSREAGS